MGLYEDREQLIEAARALVARGQAKFTISAVCAEAGVARAAFHDLFGGKAALLQALDAPQVAKPVAAEAAAPEWPQDETPQGSKAASSEPGVSTPDAWLERRLRVFERALTALEAKADLTAQAHALAIARLEERLAAAPLASQTVPEPSPMQEPQGVAAAEAAPVPKTEVPAPDLLPPEPVPMVFVSKEEMTEVLQVARTKVSVAAELPVVDRNIRLRWLTIGALSVVVLLACVGLTLGDTAGARAVGEGVAHRHAPSGLARLMAQADFGNAQARTRLALAYLRGGDAQSAARWGEAAAESGQPVAQYLAGALSGDKARAFVLFRAAAGQGNLKAMHNLAIAYAQGDGIEKDTMQAADWFARAAAHGYVDSAFDLAVLYERGDGVKQDPRQALKWYAIAAQAGDAVSAQRAAFLRSQLGAADVKLADAAARSFSPLPVTGAANTL